MYRISLRNIKNIYKRDFASYWNTPIAYIFLVFFSISTNFFYYYVNRYWDTGREILPFFSWLQIIYIFYIPAVTMRLWAEEKKDGTIEILFSLPVKTIEFILAKYMSAVTLLFVALFLTFPVVFTSLYTTNPDIIKIMLSYTGMFFLGACYIAIGIFISWYCANQITAFLTTTAVCFFLYILGYGPAIKLMGPIKNILPTFSVSWHFEAPSKGILDSRDFIYFFLFIPLFLYLNYISIEKARGCLNHQGKKFTDKNQNHWDAFWNSSRLNLILWLLAFLLVNYVSEGLYLRADISQRGNLRISDTTKKLIRELPERVTIEAFFSGDVPDHFIKTARDVKNLLKEYQNVSTKKINLLFLDPDSSATTMDRAKLLGAWPVEISYLTEDSSQVKHIYFSIALSLYGKTRVLSEIKDLNNLEYILTSAIYDLVYPAEQREIGFALNGSNFYISEKSGTKRKKLDFLVSMQNLRKELSAVYQNIQEIDLRDKEISPWMSTLILPTPQKLSRSEKIKIDQFIMSGGNLILAVNGLYIDFVNFQGSPIHQDTIDFFKHYHILIHSNIIVEPENYLPIRYQLNPSESIEIPYPVWSIITKEWLNQKHPITAGLNGLFTPYASGIDCYVKIEIHRVNCQKLAQSSSESFLIWNFPTIEPSQLYDFVQEESKKQKKTGPYNVVLYTEGIFNSFFQPKFLQKYLGTDYSLESPPVTRLLAVSTPFVLTDTALQGAKMIKEGISTNVAFLLSAVDFMNGRGSLLKLNTKRAQKLFYKNMTFSEKRFITFLNFTFPLLAIILFAIVYFLRRRKLSKSIYG